MKFENINSLRILRAVWVKLGKPSKSAVAAALMMHRQGVHQMECMGQGLGQMAAIKAAAIIEVDQTPIMMLALEETARSAKEKNFWRELNQQRQYLGVLNSVERSLGILPTDPLDLTEASSKTG